jgi:NAD(P)-dependent dehydrogenase (short-subunit alcohol dehydrogenase family)
MTTFANQVVLITGAASGIGRQLTRALIAEGARVGALDCNAGALADLEKELIGKPIAIDTADVTDAVATSAIVRELEAKLGPTDLLIASAGIGKETSARNYSAELVADIIRVNLIGVSNTIAAVLPGMRDRRRGHIAALSSLASCRGLPRMAAYCASKAGVNALLDALRVELAPLGITVTTICPAWINTPMVGAANLPEFVRLMPVEEAARRILGALRKRRAYFAFPMGAAWQARLLRFLPRWLSDWMTARYARWMENQEGHDAKG